MTCFVVQLQKRVAATVVIVPANGEVGTVAIPFLLLQLLNTLRAVTEETTSQTQAQTFKAFIIAR